MAAGETGESYEPGKTKLEAIEMRDVTVSFFYVPFFSFAAAAAAACSARREVEGSEASFLSLDTAFERVLRKAEQHYRIR